MRKTRLLYTVILLLGMTACSSSEDEPENEPVKSAEELYEAAIGEFADKNYKEAVKSFEEVERQHPSSEWAVSAQIMAGYASFKAADYDAAVASFERFAKLYPNNEYTPYTYYMIAICYYDQITDVGRDQKVTEQAMQALREVIRRFPDSEYARDARIKLDLTQDHLAGKEMQVGRYYLRNEQYIAAINRFRYVVENHQTTSHVPEALHRLVESYLKLGVVDEAQRYAAVLGYNFPSSIWYRDSYALMNGGAKPREWEEAEEEEEEPVPDDGKLRELPAGVAAPVEEVTGRSLDAPSDSSLQETPADEEKDNTQDDKPALWERVLPW